MFYGQGLHGATFLMTLSCLVSGVWFQTLTIDIKNLSSVYVFLCQSFLWSMKQISVIREDSDYFAHKVQLFELELGPELCDKLRSSIPGGRIVPP